jgi:hypothetical protein
MTLYLSHKRKGNTPECTYCKAPRMTSSTTMQKFGQLGNICLSTRLEIIIPPPQAAQKKGTKTKSTKNNKIMKE